MDKREGFAEIPAADGQPALRIRYSDHYQGDVELGHAAGTAFLAHDDERAAKMLPGDWCGYPAGSRARKAVEMGFRWRLRQHATALYFGPNRDRLRAHIRWLAAQGNGQSDHDTRVFWKGIARGAIQISVMAGWLTSEESLEFEDQLDDTRPASPLRAAPESLSIMTSKRGGISDE